MTFQIDTMQLADVEAVRSLEQQVFVTTWQPEAFANELRNNPTATYLVLRAHDGSVAGYAGFWLVQDEAHITSIALHPEYRNRRLGLRLLHALVQRATQLGALWVTLEVRADNVAAHKLYKRFGFARVGVRPKYYEGRYDAWIMWAGNLQGELYRQRMNDIAAGWEALHG